jgi:quercetin dioxygenase-like cupin family protein
VYTRYGDQEEPPRPQGKVECEQATFLLSGSGLHLTDRAEVSQETGDAIYVSKGEWHGFRNTGTEVARLVTLHGAGSLAEAGYESFAGQPDVKRIPRVAIIRLRDLQGDVSLNQEAGFVGLGVFWLITRETVGAENILLGASTFEPSGVHQPHRHPDGDEILLLLMAAVSI